MFQICQIVLYTLYITLETDQWRRFVLTRVNHCLQIVELLLQFCQLIVGLECQAVVLVSILDLVCLQKELFDIIEQRVHACVTLFAADMLHQYPSVIALVTLSAFDSLDTTTMASSRIARIATSFGDFNTIALTLALLTASQRVIPMIWFALITP